MIVSKTNLLPVHVTRADSKVPMLDNVMVAADGSSVGSSGRSLVVVSPVEDKVRDKLKTILADNGHEDIILSADTVKEILKVMGSDKHYGGLLEHCNVERQGEEEVKVTFTDGKRTKTIAGRRYTRKYVPYQNVVRQAVDSAAKRSLRTVVNLKRLLHLLETIDKMCPDKTGESPVWMEFGGEGEIIVRAVNFVNEQRVIGIMGAYQGTEGKWLDYTEWEGSFLDKGKRGPHGETLEVVKHKRKAESKIETKHRRR